LEITRTGSTGGIVNGVLDRNVLARREILDVLPPSMTVREKLVAKSYGYGPVGSPRTRSTARNIVICNCVKWVKVVQVVQVKVVQVKVVQVKVVQVKVVVEQETEV
jgi:hypothetical protein